MPYTVLNDLTTNSSLLLCRKQYNEQASSINHHDDLKHFFFFPNYFFYPCFLKSPSPTPQDYYTGTVALQLHLGGISSTMLVIKIHLQIKKKIQVQSKSESILHPLHSVFYNDRVSLTPGSQIGKEEMSDFLPSSLRSLYSS